MKTLAEFLHKYRLVLTNEMVDDLDELFTNATIQARIEGEFILTVDDARIIKLVFRKLFLHNGT